MAGQDVGISVEILLVEIACDDINGVVIAEHYRKLKHMISERASRRLRNLHRRLYLNHKPRAFGCLQLRLFHTYIVKDVQVLAA